MPYIVTEMEDDTNQTTDFRNKKKMLQFYNDFMAEKKSTPKSYNSLEDFKASPAYQQLSEKEKEYYKKYENKNVIILTFDSAEQAKEFVERAKSKGLISEKQASKALSQIEELSQIKSSSATKDSPQAKVLSPIKDSPPVKKLPQADNENKSNPSMNM